MNYQDRVKQHFTASIETKMRALEVLTGPITAASAAMVECLLAEGKILAAATAVPPAIRSTSRRTPEPFRTRTACLAGHCPDHRHLDAHLHRQRLQLCRNLLQADSRTGPRRRHPAGHFHERHSVNVLEAIKVAHQRNLRVVALTGKEGGAMRELLRDSDIEICVPSAVTRASGSASAGHSLLVRFDRHPTFWQ